MDVLDIGCGTGILAILAKKLGANRVLAVDYDELSVEAAIENVQRNKVDVEVRHSDLFSNVDGKFDIIVSNIVAEVLLVMLSQVKNYLKDDGVIILSGIINEKVHLFNKFNIIEQTRLDEWNALALKI